MLKPLPNYEDPGKRRLAAVRAASERDLEGLIQLLTYYLLYKSRKRARTSPKTYTLYGLGVRDFLAWAWPEGAPGPRVPILKATADDVDRWLSELLETGGHLEEARGTPLSPATAAAYLAGVRALYRALVWAGAVGKNPAAEVPPPRDPTPRGERRPAMPLTLYRRLLATLDPGKAEGLRDRLVYRLMGDVGLRVAEVEALDLEDLDPHEGELRVRGKGQKVRTVPLPPDLAAELAGWLRIRSAHAVPGEKALFVNLGGRRETGKRLRAWTIRKRLAARLRALGAPERYHGPHSLRHLAGTRLYRATGDLYLVAALLGHSDMSTSQVYAKMDLSRLREAVRRLAR